MSEFIDSLLIYWDGFSNGSQNVIGQIGYSITGQEIGVGTKSWIFYGALALVVFFLVRARQAKIRNQIETRQRFDI